MADDSPKSGKSATNSAEEAVELVKQKASEVADQVQEKFGEAYEEVSARAVETAETVQDYAQQAADKIDVSLQSRPLTTIAAFVAFGFLLGAISSR